MIFMGGHYQGNVVKKYKHPLDESTIREFPKEQKSRIKVIALDKTPQDAGNLELQNAFDRSNK